MKNPIGVFDSGYGGLTVLRELQKVLPSYDFLYLGDNARSPYGSRSFDVIYEYTLQAVEYLIAQGCPLVILACNTASARALRTIQQKDLPSIAPSARVLGIIRPVAEYLATSTQGNIGVVATEGTVKSESYVLEIQKLDATRVVLQQACPMWVPLVEHAELNESGELFVQRDLEKLFQQDSTLKQIVLACTHYPLLLPLIQKNVPNDVQIIEQGPIVANSLSDYLHRHPEMNEQLTKNGSLVFQTSEDPQIFKEKTQYFLGLDDVQVHKIQFSTK